MDPVRTKVILAAVLFLTLQSFSARGAQVAGITLPDQVQPEGMEQPLRLNGAGIRRKLFFKIYIGALYLPEEEHSAAAILGGNAPNRVLMHFLYNEVSREKLTAGWQDGFEANHDAAAVKRLAPEIARFSSLFSDARKGDRIWIDHLPGQGTRVTINGVVEGRVPGDEFNRALLHIWLGREPASDDLKRAMLGLE